MAPGPVIGAITNGLHRDHRGIRRVGKDAPARPLPLVSPAEHIVIQPHLFRRRAIAWLAVLLAAVAVALTVAPRAQATAAAPAVPCWRKLLIDWYDGRIDHAYPVRCYREAIRELPEDVKVYADAAEDINRALLQAIRRSKQDTGENPTQETPVRPPTPKPSPAQPETRTETTGTETGGAVSGGPDPGEPPIASGPVDASRSDSVPLPLIVLGALALLLLAAAGVGMGSRRLQTRRLGATPPTSEEPPPA
jgi:hypothetical protein